MIDYAAAARELVLRTRTAQGLPTTVDDEATLRTVARILARNDESPPKRAPDTTLTLSDATDGKSLRGR